jgi:hypothetical protein
MKSSRRREPQESASVLPSPPPMQSPTVAAWRVPPEVVRRDRWPSLAILLLIFGILPILGGTPDLVDWIIAFGIAILIWLITGRTQKRRAVSVGKDWLCVSNAGGTDWVRTDQLTRLKWHVDGDFSMRDRDRRRIVVNPELLKKNPEVFRVFASGVRLSVAGGLLLDGALSEELGLEPAAD